ncbi:unnamed protein product [Urochloa humidicola]
MWVVDIEKMLDDDEADPVASPAEEWRSHCIFRVPPHFKMAHGSAFRPQAVTLGPFHHNRDRHSIMEGHKRRAVRHLLRRAGRTLRELAAAVEEVADELEDAYAGLDAEWRGRNRGRFLEMMIADGCFLLEVMRNYAIEMNKPYVPATKESNDYSPSDPVFSPHAVVHIAAFLQRDMLMIENQLPLPLFQRIVTVEGRSSDDVSINKLVLGFLGVDADCDAHVGAGLGLHPLELYRRSLLRPKKVTITSILLNRDRRPVDKEGPDGDTGADADADDQDRRRTSYCYCIRQKERKTRQRQKAAAPRSAQKLWEAGIRFRRSDTAFLDDVSFHGRRREVRMPGVVLDDSAEYAYHNVMAFEALHAGTSNAVTAFVLFMRDMVESPADVDLLARRGILRNELAGDDSEVVGLFNGLTKDVAKTRQSVLCRVHDDIEDYCRISWIVYTFEAWATFKRNYLSSPWAFIALLVGVFLLVTNVMQTAYAVLSYDPKKRA